MTLLDVGNCVVVSSLHSPASFSADRDGNSVDTAKYAYAFILINLGDIYSGETITFHVEQATTSGGTYTACKKLNTTDDATTAAFAHANDNEVKIIAIDLNNTQRFIRLRANHSASNAHLYSASLVLMPYLTNTVSDDANAASAPLFNV
jgi:hypothetical protein